VCACVCAMMAIRGIVFGRGGICDRSSRGIGSGPTYHTPKGRE